MLARSVRPVPTTCIIKDVLVGHCINFFLAKQPTKSYQCLKTFQNAKVNTLFANTPKMKDISQLFIFCVLTFQQKPNSL